MKRKNYILLILPVLLLSCTTMSLGNQVCIKSHEEKYTIDPYLDGCVLFGGNNNCGMVGTQKVEKTRIVCDEYGVVSSPVN